VHRARVVLDDHHASEEINHGMDDGRSFGGTFPGETAGDDLEELRSIFRRKSFVSRQEQLCRTLRMAGRSPEELAAMRLGQMTPSQELEKYLERRAELGLDISDEAPLIVDPDGNPVPEDAVVQHLRFARTVRISIEGNASVCRGLLATRYGIKEGEEATA
jgi:hypothetical protein